MVAYNKFNVFVKDRDNGVHNFGTHTIKVMLSNTLPVAANAVKADITEIAAGNGYVAGGIATPASVSISGGTAKVTLTDEVFVAAGGPISPFRYVIVYNDTPSSPAKPLIGWYDYGSSISLGDTETFTVDFDGTNGFFTDT